MHIPPMRMFVPSRTSLCGSSTAYSRVQMKWDSQHTKSSLVWFWRLQWLLATHSSMLTLDLVSSYYYLIKLARNPCLHRNLDIVATLNEYIRIFQGTCGDDYSRVVILAYFFNLRIMLCMQTFEMGVQAFGNCIRSLGRRTWNLFT